MLALTLRKQDKKDELAKVSARIDELEIKGHRENEKQGLGYTPVKFAGRKGNRVVLVELFTGAHCPPCVAADLAFEGLGKTYSTSEVVLLQYHLHIPRPDPLTTPDCESRAKFYGDEVGGTPSIFFNGKSAAAGGGMRPHAGGKYQAYRDVIDPILGGDNKISLTADAQQTGGVISINTTAKGYKAGKSMKLRLVVIEPWVRYPGSNGLSYHAHVVRAAPAGFVLEKDEARETMKIDLADVRTTASKRLEDFPMLDGQRPFNFRSLRLVAFVQDDDTKEVLHAIEVPIKQ